jgi:hypothetical protein
MAYFKALIQYLPGENGDNFSYTEWLQAPRHSLQVLPMGVKAV